MTDTHYLSLREWLIMSLYEAIKELQEKRLEDAYTTVKEVLSQLEVDIKAANHD